MRIEITGISYLASNFLLSLISRGLCKLYLNDIVQDLLFLGSNSSSSIISDLLIYRKFLSVLIKRRILNKLNEFFLVFSLIISTKFPLKCFDLDMCTLKTVFIQLIIKIRSFIRRQALLLIRKILLIR